MGFRYRKRTGNKNAWINWFGSGNGLGASVSVKLGNATMNFGKGRRRVTYNFGNGFSYVKQRSTKERIEKEPKQRTIKHTKSYSDSNWLMKQFLFGMTQEEYTDWYNSLSEEDKKTEDTRLDKDISRWKRERAVEDRKFEKEMYDREHPPIWQVILYVSFIVLINPLFWLASLIFYLFYNFNS